MKTGCIPSAALALSLVSAFPTYGRIGENPAQCNERYGEATYKNVDGDLEFRSYNFNQKTVRVIFHKTISVYESITTTENPTLGSSETVKKALTDFRLFFVGLLSGAYQFSDGQTNELLGPAQQKTGAMVIFGPVANGALVAKCWISFSDDEQTFHCVATILKYPKGIDWDKVMDFLEASEAIELKHQEINRAQGF